jgi:hypothetical protein
MNRLPVAMEELGVESLKLKSGHSVVVKKGVKASIPAKHVPDALKWLRDNGHGSIIKNEVKISFGRGEEGEADATVSQLEEQGRVVTRKENVNSRTLSAFVKERLEQGDDVPFDLLGVFEYKQSIINQ